MRPEAKPHWLLSGGGLCGRPVSVECGRWLPASGVREGREWSKHQTSGTPSKASSPSCHSACVRDKNKTAPGMQAYQLLSSHSALQESFIQPHWFLKVLWRGLCAFSASASISAGVSLHGSFLYKLSSPIQIPYNQRDPVPQPRVHYLLFFPY